MGGRLEEVIDLGRAGFAMGYDIETCYEFVRQYSKSPKPSRRFIMKILNELMEGMK